MVIELNKISHKSKRVHRSINWFRLATVLGGFVIVITIFGTLISSLFSNSSNQSETPQNPQIAEKNLSSKDAIRTLLDFHDGITKKNYRQSYNCLSKEFQTSLNYDSWAKGFKTTVSSSVSNVQVASETNLKIVLRYDLKAVDEPGGTSNFRGTVTLIKTSDGWKINDIMNRFVP